MLRRRTTILSVVLAAAALALPPAALAGDEIAVTPDPTILGLGLCLPLNPCTLQEAIGKAKSGDTIVLQSGRHQLTAPLELPEGVSIVGEPGKVHAELGATLDLLGPTLTVRRATVRHLQIGSTGLAQPAIRVRDGGTVEDVAAVSALGPAVNVGAEKDEVLVRDSVLVSRSSDASLAALQLEKKKPVTVLNVTVWAAFGAGGIRCDDKDGATTIRNTLVRGTAYDVKGGSGACTVAYSGVRPAKLQSVTAGAGNVAEDPQVFDAAVQNFRPVSGSPMIDAGTTDPRLSATDLDGRARTQGRAPDIGAYESTETRPAPDPDPGTDPTGDGGGSGDPAPGGGTDDPAPTPGKSGDDHGRGSENRATPATPATPGAGPATPAIPAVPATPAAPALGKSVVLDADEGKVKVKLPGTDTFVALADAKTLPVGTVVDATDGTVTLTSQLPGGRTQSGEFTGGAFQVRQPRDAQGMTDIVLTGGSFARCGARAAKSTRVTANAAAATAKKKGAGKSVRKLWAKDEGGRFRTHGASSVTTVRGTRWLTEDRCDGTYTKVTAGAVDVRAKRTGRVTRVRRGESLLVPANGTR